MPSPSLGFVHGGGVVVEADPHGEAVAVALLKAISSRSKRRIGRMALVSTSISKPRPSAASSMRQDLAVHERLAAREADLAGRQAQRRDLVEIGLTSPADR